MNDKPSVPKEFISIDTNEIMRDYQKNTDSSVIQPDFNFEKTADDALNNLNQSIIKRKDHPIRDNLISGVLGGLIVLAVEHCMDIYYFILSLIP